jgi:hypothetical protein
MCAVQKFPRPTFVPGQHGDAMFVPGCCTYTCGEETPVLGIDCTASLLAFTGCPCRAESQHGFDPKTIGMTEADAGKIALVFAQVRHTRLPAAAHMTTHQWAMPLGCRLQQVGAAPCLHFVGLCSSAACKCMRNSLLHGNIPQCRPRCATAPQIWEQPPPFTCCCCCCCCGNGGSCCVAQYDADDNGRIDLSEFRKLLSDLGSDVSEEEAKAALEVRGAALDRLVAANSSSNSGTHATAAAAFGTSTGEQWMHSCTAGHDPSTPCCTRFATR